MIRERSSSDPLWWAIAGLLGLGAVWVPRTFNIGGDSATQTLIIETGLFLAGGFLGALRPRRAWRWPLAAFLAFALADVALMANGSGSGPIGIAAVTDKLIANIPAYGLHTLPVLIGVYIGALTATEGPK